jgi:hypothetical protein
MSLPKMLEQVGGIQAQYAPSAYVGVWSRLEGFERGQLTHALERRTVVVGTLMRVTIHLVSARDYWPFAHGLRDARRQVMAKNTPFDERALAAAAKRVRAALTGTTMTTAEMRTLLGEKGGNMSAGYWLDLMRVPPSSTWERRKADIHALAEEWLEPVEVDPDDAVDHLVRSYLRGFGPAPTRDIASWAGLPVKTVTASLGRLELRRFKSEDGGELFDLPRAPLPDPGTPAPVRFLPRWDANTLVHARRTGVLPEEYRPRLFDARNPRSLSTFLVDGAIAGSWAFDDGRIQLDPFEKLDRATLRELKEEGERLAAFHL